MKKCFKITNFIYAALLVFSFSVRANATADVGMKITSVTIGISADKFEEAVSWYKKILGPRETIQPVPGIAEFELSSGAWLQVFQTKKVLAGDSVVRLGVENIDVESTRLKNLGITVSDIERIEGVIAMFDFVDPFGNKLSLYQVLQ